MRWWLNKSCLLLGKGVYSYEYMYRKQRFNETALEKKEFYSNLNMEDINDADYQHEK